MNLRNLIDEIADFPKEGIIYRDICPLLSNAEGFSELIRTFSSIAKKYEPDLIAGIESRGFIMGSALASSINKGFIPIRKAGKLPGNVIGIDYTLEYGSDRLELQENNIKSNQRILVIDDLLATGGTAKAAIDLINKAKGRVICCLFAIELDSLKGRSKLPKDINIKSILNYS